MPSLSDYLEGKVLDYVFGAQSFSAPGTLYIGLYTAAPTDAGGGTEVSGGSYARVSVTNNSTNFPNASGTTPKTKQNGTQITFPTATANWGTIVAVGIFDASSAGNLLGWSPMTGTPYTFTALASTDVFTAPGSSFADTNEVWLANTVGGTLPTGVNDATKYFIRDSSGITFKLAASSGGAAIDISANGSGRIALTTPKIIQNGDTAVFAVNALTITAD